MGDVLVVGAGPAGLTAAWRAAASGHQVLVVERADRVGGMAASHTVAGQRVDLGSHRLHPAAPPPLLAALRALLGEDLQVRVRRGRLHLADRWLEFPLRASDVFRRTPWRFGVSFGRDVVTKPLRREKADTFAEVVRAKLGPTMLRDFYGPYAGKLWGTDPSKLSGELARRRIAAMGATAMARRLLQARHPAGRAFLYPRLGFGQIVEGVADAATEAGAEILLKTEVTELVEGYGDDGVEVILTDGQRKHFSHVLWTAPPRALVGAMREVPPDVATYATAQRHRAMVLVYLVVAQPRYSEFDAHYVPDARFPVARLSEPKNYRSGPDPESTTVLCAEVPCWPGDETWRASDAALCEMVTSCLVGVGLPEPKVEEVSVVRRSKVYPVYAPGDELRFARVESWSRQLPFVTLLGRQGTFVADNTHHVMAMGWDAAEALDQDGRLDPAAWRAARSRHAGHIIED